MSVPLSVVARLKAIQAWDRARLARIRRRHPGLVIHPSASSNLAGARFQLARGAQLRIGAHVVTERIAGALLFLLEEDAVVEIGDGSWLRTEIEPVQIVAGRGARITLGPDGFLNGCHVSAKRAIHMGRRVWIGFGSRVIDADQHPLDADTPERVEPIRIDDHVWVAGDCTVMRGVHIGAHSVIGARSTVTRDVPAHTLAFGQPARPRGEVRDRSATP
jgi:acetyltransferase-like isoleucine patch superfamily enzyme